jgi:2-polyprenyl-6-methoxyphenol hydroxylase-like FAD-dependent oxidoreductase
MSTGREHAIVMGAGIAGLLAARALSPHFKRVTVVDRDALPETPAPREGVPQGKHIHVLLPGGLGAVDRLFPGCVAELLENGAQPFDYGQSQFYFTGKWMPRIPTGLNTLAQTRPFLEHHMRRWVGELPNVEIVHANVSALLWDSSRERVLGIAASHAELPSDLVIDATGKNSRLPRWLAEEKFPLVAETKVGIDLGYATGCFRIPDRLRPAHPMLYIVGPPPHQTRVGVRVLVEGGVVYGGMGGYHGDHPPSDLQGFLEFARSLSQPDVFDVLSHCELISPIARYRIPSANRRHYARMQRFPRGVLPLGDSVCNFDPVFGQGMAVTALEAEALADSLHRHGAAEDAVRKEYFRRIESVIEVAWDMCAGENFKYPQTTGRRPLLFELTRRYKDRVTTCEDPSVVHDVYRVSALTASPRILLRPGVVARTFGLL